MTKYPIVRTFTLESVPLPSYVAGLVAPYSRQIALHAMLDIEFFSSDKQPMRRVEVADTFLLWLARTDFACIGEEAATDLSINGENLTLPLVQLAPSTRKTFIEFFTESVVIHSKQVLLQLEQGSLQSELVYRLKKLIELLDCLKNEDYYYLQRV